MYITRFVFLILALYTTKISFAQDDVIIDQAKYIANYNYIYQEDSLSSDRVKSNEMRLYLGNNYSKFEQAYSYKCDSIIRVYKNDSNQQQATQTAWTLIQQMPAAVHLSKFRVLKEKRNDTITFFESTISSKINLKVIQQLSIKWHLHASSDTLISKYKCHKATCYFAGRNYSAWYTMELPFNDGPYKFKGLPGLIVKIEDLQKHHVFELTSFNKIFYNLPIYFEEKRYKTSDMKTYYKAKKTRALELAKFINNYQTFGNVNTGEIEAKLITINNYIEHL